MEVSESKVCMRVNAPVYTGRIPQSTLARLALRAKLASSRTAMQLIIQAKNPCAKVLSGGMIPVYSQTMTGTYNTKQPVYGPHCQASRSGDPPSRPLLQSWAIVAILTSVQ